MRDAFNNLVKTYSAAVVAGLGLASVLGGAAKAYTSCQLGSGSDPIDFITVGFLGLCMANAIRQANESTDFWVAHVEKARGLADRWQAIAEEWSRQHDMRDEVDRDEEAPRQRKAARQARDTVITRTPEGAVKPAESQDEAVITRAKSPGWGEPS